MKKFFYYCLTAVALLFSSQTQGKEKAVEVIPMPVSMTLASGQFKLNDKTVVQVPFQDAALKKVAEDFVKQIQKTSGVQMALQNASEKNAAKNVIEFVHNKNLKNEAYTLDVTSKNAKIASSSAVGAFYAVQTIYQLLPSAVYGEKTDKNQKWAIPAVSIADEPRFGYRGLMLDCARHFMPLSFVKQFIDVLAMYKMNTFHWHLTDDQAWRIEIKKYPKLIEVGSVRNETVIRKNTGKYDGIEHKGYYTQDDAREIVAYAADRFITVIPEVELPGHALAALASYPELSCGLEPKYEVSKTWGVFKQVYCPKETTFKFFEDVFTELLPIFPSEYYHIGGDECPKNSWKKCENCQALIKKEGLKDEYELQSYFVHRIEKFLNSKGKQIIGWDEILEGGLAPNATVMSWRGEKGGIEAAKQKHNVIMTPNTYVYLDYYQAGAGIEENNRFGIGGFLPLEKVYSYNPIPESLKPEEHHYIKGVQGNLWSEYLKTPDDVMYRAYPRAMAVAEIDWTPQEGRNYDSFRRRMAAHYEKLETKGIKPSGLFYQPIFHFDSKKEYPKEVKMTVDYPYADIYYTTDGSEPTAKSMKYATPIQVEENMELKAIAVEKGKAIGNVSETKFKKLVPKKK